MRILDIVKTSIASDKLTLQEELERIINNKELETTKKVATIKTLMRNIATTDLSYDKFVELMTNEEEQESK